MRLGAEQAGGAYMSCPQDTVFRRRRLLRRRAFTLRRVSLFFKIERFE